MKSYLEVAIEAALEAGAILMTELARPVEINYKGEVDIVTQADGRSEQAIVARLSNHFPTHAIIAKKAERTRLPLRQRAAPARNFAGTWTR